MFERSKAAKARRNWRVSGRLVDHCCGKIGASWAHLITDHPAVRAAMACFALHL